MAGRFTKDLIVVTAGNVLYLLAQIAVGLLLPLAMSVNDFGYYKVYTLYLTYCGLLHFGLVDGMLLKFGGQDYNSLDKTRFRSYFRCFSVLELLSGVLIVLISMIFLKDEMRYIIIGVSLSMILSNLTLFFQYLSQATSRFKEFALLKGVNASLILVCVLIFLAVKHFYGTDTGFMTLIASLIVISAVILVCYLMIYRDIIWGNALPFRDIKTDIAGMIRLGIVMTLAYEASRLVLLIDRQFVSVLFDVEVYARYAFAYNILSCFTALIVGISTVLFPKFKQLPENELIGKFSGYMTGITCLVGFSLLAYFPICIIIRLLLPEYVDSIMYFQIIFPVLALSACITIMIFTFYKVLNRNLIFMKSCLLTLVVAVVFNVVAYMVFKSPEAISISSIFTTIIWYLLSIRFFVREYKVEWKRNFMYAIAVMISFYITVLVIDSLICQALIYLACILAVTYAFYGKKIVGLFSSK